MGAIASITESISRFFRSGAGIVNSPARNKSADSERVDTNAPYCNLMALERSAFPEMIFSCGGDANISVQFATNPPTVDHAPVDGKNVSFLFVTITRPLPGGGRDIAKGYVQLGRPGKGYGQIYVGVSNSGSGEDLCVGGNCFKLLKNNAGLPVALDPSSYNYLLSETDFNEPIY